MKGYVVALLDVPQSVQVAQRCIESGKTFGVDVEIFPGVYKDCAAAEMELEQLKLGTFDQKYSSLHAVIGNFISQYRIWNTILNTNQPAIVLEHDALFVSCVPNLGEDNIINLGKPSYGKFISKSTPGIYPMFSKTGGYIPGAHGYYVTATGANQLINKAREIGIGPCDIFLNKTNFPDIKEIYPWPIIAADSFTTIQKKQGCIAKHNFNQDYSII